LRRRQPETVGNLPGLKGTHPDCRLHHLAEDRIGRALGYLLDLHAALRVSHDHDALALAVEHQAEVELPIDRHGCLDIEPMHYSPFRPGLMGNQPLAQETLGRLAHLIFAGAKLDAPGLAPGAGMDLRLDRPARSADLRRAIDRLFRTIRHATFGDGHAEAGKKLFGLVLVDVHGCFAARSGESGVRSQEFVAGTTAEWAA